MRFGFAACASRFARLSPAVLVRSPHRQEILLSAGKK